MTVYPLNDVNGDPIGGVGACGHWRLARRPIDGLIFRADTPGDRPMWTLPPDARLVKECGDGPPCPPESIWEDV